MTHPIISELEQFLKGKLPAGRLLEVDEHISECTECKAALDSIQSRKSAALGLGQMLLGVKDCPEYEQLSAYVDRELNAQESKAIEAHVNLCELCSRDVSRIAELRSHALLRKPVVLKPGVTVTQAPAGRPVWVRVLAGLGAVGVAAVAVFSFNALIKQVGQKPTVAKAHAVAKPDTHQQIAHVPVKVHPKPEVNIACKPVLPIRNNIHKPAPKTGPVYALKDGKYRVIEQNGRMILANTSGKPRTALEAKIAAAINQKLKAGRVKISDPVYVAMNVAENTVVRGTADLTGAPRLIGRQNEVILTDSPVLKWHKVDMAESYRVRVYGKNNAKIFEQITDKTSIQVPALPRGGVYKWQVSSRASESSNWEDSIALRFGVISSQGVDLIRKAKGSHIALGAVYESLGLAADSHREYALARSASCDSRLTGKLR